MWCVWRGRVEEVAWRRRRGLGGVQETFGSERTEHLGCVDGACLGGAEVICPSPGTSPIGGEENQARSAPDTIQTAGQSRSTAGCV